MKAATNRYLGKCSCGTVSAATSSDRGPLEQRHATDLFPPGVVFYSYFTGNICMTCRACGLRICACAGKNHGASHV